LSVKEVTESENKEGKLYRPISFCKCRNDIYKFILNAKSAFFEEIDDCKSDIFEKKRYSAEKEAELIPKRLPLIQL